MDRAWVQNLLMCHSIIRMHTVTTSRSMTFIAGAAVSEGADRNLCCPGAPLRARGHDVGLRSGPGQSGRSGQPTVSSTRCADMPSKVLLPCCLCPSFQPKDLILATSSLDVSGCASKVQPKDTEQGINPQDVVMCRRICGCQREAAEHCSIWGSI